MRRPIPMLSVLFAAMACGACEKSSDATKHDLTQNAKETLQSTKDLLAQKQEEFRKVADQKLKEIDPKIQELKQKARDATGDAKVQLEKLTAKLEDERKAAADELARWKEIGADKWQSFTSTLSKKLDDLEHSVKSATSK